MDTHVHMIAHDAYFKSPKITTQQVQLSGWAGWIFEKNLQFLVAHLQHSAAKQLVRHENGEKVGLVDVQNAWWLELELQVTWELR